MAARDIRGVLRPAAPVSSPGLLPEEQPLTWPRLDDGEIRLRVVDQDGSPVDVTGWQFTWTVRERNDKGEAEALLSRSGAVTDAAAGAVSFGIDAGDWTTFVENKTYRHDVVGVDADGARHQVVPQSALSVLPAVAQPGDVPTVPVGPTALPYPVASVLGEHGVEVDDTDPRNPIIRLGWDGLVGDNQLIVRNGDALVGWNKPVADFDQSSAQRRYFMIDPVNGDDDNVGYLDGTNDSAFTPAQRVGVPLRTYDEFLLRFEAHGAGRRYTLLVSPMPDGSVLLDKAGQPQDLTLVGHTGSASIDIRGSDLSNDVNDKTTAPCIATDIPPGDPNGDGSWTVTASAAGWVEVAAAPPLTAIGRRLRPITGSATALRTRIERMVGNRLYLGSTGTTLAVGDRFLLERAKVRFNNVVASFGGWKEGRLSSSLPEALQLIALDAQGETRLHVVPGGVRTSFFSTASLRATSLGTFNMIGVWFDLTDAMAVTTRAIGPSWIGGTLVIASVEQLTLVDAGFHGTTTSITFVHRVVSYSATFLKGASISSCGNGAIRGIGSPAHSIGFAAAFPVTTMGTMNVNESSVVFRYLRAKDCAGPVIKVNGKGSAVSLDGFESPDGGNADVILDMQESQGSSAFIGREIANLATAAVGLVRTQGAGVLAAWTDVDERETFDAAKNRYIGSGTISVTNDLSAIRATDPASPRDGDRWVVNSGGIRQLCFRISGATYRTTLT